MLLVAVLLQTSFATWFMLSILPYNGGTRLEIGMAGIFAILFYWISLGFWIGVFGFVLRLMGGHTLVQMVQLMQRQPEVGILQSSPSLLNGQSVFARIQQLFNQLYGPLFTTGLAAILPCD